MNKHFAVLQRFSGILAILLTWTTIFGSISKAHLDILSDTPISSLGVNPLTMMVFEIGLIIAALLMIMFGIYVYRVLQTSKIALVVFVIGQVGQIILSVAPYNADNFIKPVHVIAAYLLAFSLPLSMALFTFSAKAQPQLRRLNRYFLIAGILFFVFGILWFIFSTQAGALSEIKTAIVFDVWIVVLSVKLLMLPKNT